MVLITSVSKEGFDVALEDNDFIILNTELTKELVNEGIAREFVSKVQNLRKQKDFDIVDRINIYYSSDSLVNDSLDQFKEFIKNETLAIEIIRKDIGEEFDLNGHKALIDVEKVES